MQIEEAGRADMAVIESLRVMTAAGKGVPIKSVAAIAFAKGPSTVERYDRERRAAIGTDLVGGMTLGEGVARFKALPDAQNLPKGVRLQETGEAELMGEVFTGFAFAMGTGILLVLAVLLLLFGSVFQPVTILLSLPLSIGGVVAALLITNKAISMPVVIGMLMLMGIVTKNAIMLVDFAIEQVKLGVHRFEAIVDAGRKRARPIVMTTIAMVAGMLPSAYGLADGGEFRAPMAIAVIGGLIASTILSLVFVPSFYTVMDDVGVLFARILGGLAGPKEEEEPVAGGRYAHVQPPEPAPAAAADVNGAKPAKSGSKRFRRAAM